MKAIRARGHTGRHEPEHGCAFDSKQAGFWSGKGTTRADRVEQNARERKVHHAMRRRGEQKTPQEIRILYLKKRHQIAKLMRKYPEIDWYAQERDRAKQAEIQKRRGPRAS